MPTRSAIFLADMNNRLRKWPIRVLAVFPRSFANVPQMAILHKNCRSHLLRQQETAAVLGRFHEKSGKRRFPVLLTRMSASFAQALFSAIVFSQCSQ